LPQRNELVAEDARLRNRAARIVHPMDHEELCLQAIGELDRASVAPQLAVLIRIAHQLAKEIPEMLLALVPHPVQVADADPRNGGTPEIWLLRGRDESHKPAVASTEHHEPVSVNVWQRREILRAGRDVLEIGAAPVPERRIPEVDAVAGRATDVRLEHDEPAVDEELRERIESAEPLPGRPAVHVHQRRQLLARGDVLWPVQKSWHLLAVEGLVPDVLGIHEDLLVDRTVLGLDERLGGVCREVVGNERGTREIRGVVQEELRVVREELSALLESIRPHKFAGLVYLYVVEDRPNLGFLVPDRHQPFAVL